VDDSTEQSVRNQRIFREVNERLREIADPSTTLTEFLCECSDLDCCETIELDVSAYEAIRSTPNAFLVVAGHESFERVLEDA
jgi:hypothetical protein